MIEQDTIKLLRECDAGVKMGVASIDDVLPHVRAEDMKERLQTCKREHEQLGSQIETALAKYHDDGKDPNPIAKGMSYMKTTFKLGLNETDETVASLMTDGCNMGVKSLNRYLNEYGAAEEYAKDITKKLIHLEQQLATDLQQYL